MPAYIKLPAKSCAQCGREFNRGRLRGGRPESVEDYEKRRFCSPACYHKWNHGENHQNWAGGWRHRSDGYVRDAADRYQHRLIVEAHLARELKPTEFVHHLDGDPSNNRIENLAITTNAAHRAQHAATQIRDEKGRFARAK